MKPIIAYMVGDKIYSNNKEAFDLKESQSFGEKINEKIFYMLEEALYLSNQKKLTILNTKLKEISEEEFVKKCNRITKNFLTRYFVYEDLRKKGYTIKSGFKFGSDFRIYEPGKKMNKHSKWLCLCVNEKDNFSWTEFSSKNRIANSTKKKLLIGILDSENKVTYYEFSWIKRP